MNAEKAVGSILFLIGVYLFVASYSDGTGGAGQFLTGIGNAVTDTTLTLQGRGGGSTGNKLGRV